MKPIFSVMILGAGLLAGCMDGTNPFQDAEMEPDPDSEGSPDPDSIFATDLNEDLTMNAFEYDDAGTGDPSDDTMRINNIPFDNSDATGGGYTRSATALPNAFDVYESPLSGGPNDRQYFAVFQRASHSEVAAVGTGDYISFGFGGATLQRLDGTNGIPAERPEYYTFTGDYAAVRITTLSGGEDDVEFITGDTELTVDILDFDVDGAVEGLITNRTLYDVNGNSLGALNDYVSLATAEIDFSTGEILQSTAVGIEGVTGQIASGGWQGVFAGPDGEEIAGFVVLEGDVTSTEVDDTVRETGVFITANGG